VLLVGAFVLAIVIMLMFTMGKYNFYFETNYHNT